MKIEYKTVDRIITYYIDGEEYHVDDFCKLIDRQGSIVSINRRKKSREDFNIWCLGCIWLTENNFKKGTTPLHIGNGEFTCAIDVADKIGGYYSTSVARVRAYRKGKLTLKGLFRPICKNKQRVYKAASRRAAARIKKKNADEQEIIRMAANPVPHTFKAGTWETENLNPQVFSQGSAGHECASTRGGAPILRGD